MQLQCIANKYTAICDVDNMLSVMMNNPFVSMWFLYLLHAVKADLAGSGWECFGPNFVAHALLPKIFLSDVNGPTHDEVKDIR